MKKILVLYALLSFAAVNLSAAVPESSASADNVAEECIQSSSKYYSNYDKLENYNGFENYPQEELYKKSAEEHKKTLALCKKAALSGSIEGMLKTGRLLEEGDGYYAYDPKEAIKWYKMAADKGDPLGYSGLGRIYKELYIGERENAEDENIYKNICKVKSKLYKDAVHWHSKAAEAGNAESQTELGILYECDAKASGGKESPMSEKAINMYTSAYRQGYDEGGLELAKAYIEGTIVQRSYDEAFKILTSLAKKGNYKAKEYLGDMIYEGKGTQKDYNLAMDKYLDSWREGRVWFKKDLENAGEYTRKTNWGMLSFLNQYDFLKEDYLNKAFEHKTQIRHKKLNKKVSKKARETLFVVAVRPYCDNVDDCYDIIKAKKILADIHWFLNGMSFFTVISSDEGHPFADRMLSEAKRNGDFESQAYSTLFFLTMHGLSDFRKTIKSAENGQCTDVYLCSSAEFLLGYVYKMGLAGRQADQDKSMEYMTKAAEHGNQSALTYLGEYYLGKNEKKALEMLYKAESFPPAMYAIGNYYSRTGNHKEAAEWYSKAACEGNILALNYLSFLASDDQNSEYRYRLGILYKEGSCLPENKEMAAMLFKQAAAKGHKEAKKELRQ